MKTLSRYSIFVLFVVVVVVVQYPTQDQCCVSPSHHKSNQFNHSFILALPLSTPWEDPSFLKYNFVHLSFIHSCSTSLPADPQSQSSGGE